MNPEQLQTNLSNKFPDVEGLLVSSDEQGGDVAIHLGTLDLGLGSPTTEEEWSEAEEKAIKMVRFYLEL